MKRYKFFNLFLAIILSGCVTVVQSATILWNSTVTGNFNVGTNWVGNVAPGASDIAKFDGTKDGNCNITAAITVAGIEVAAGYSGTITQSSAMKITIGTSNAILGGGIFAGSNADIVCNGSFTLSGTTFTSTSDTLHLNGAVTSSGGSFAHNAGSVRFNSTGAQTVPAWMYNSLYIAGSRTTQSVTLASGTIGIYSAFGNSATFTTGNFIKTGNTIDYNGGNSQTVIAFNYNGLTLSNYHDIKNITLANTGTIGIEGVFTNSATFSTGSIISTGSTIEYYGGSQTILPFSYYNLTFSGTGNKVLGTTGTIFIKNTFVKGANQIISTGSTVDYNGAGVQTVVTMNYGNLIVSGSRAGSITFSNSGIIGVFGTFNPSATYTSGSWVMTGSTVDFKGAAQFIPSFTFENLTCSGSGDKTATGSITVNSTLTINAGRYLDLATYRLLGITNTSGTGELRTQYTSSSPIPATKTWSFAVVYNGAAQSLMGGTYNGILTCSGSGTKTAAATLAANLALNVATGCTVDMSTFALTGSVTSTTGPGLLKTQNGTATPIPASKTWNMPVEYYGTLAQSAVAGTYKDLTISGTRGANTFTLASGTINISGVFAVSMTGTIAKSGNVINYNGQLAQTVIAFNYNDLTISGIRSTNSVTLASSGTIGVFGAYINSATYAGGSLITTGSTIDYNGTGAQTITAATYENLSVSNAHAANNITLQSGTITVKGNYSNTATFAGGVFVTTGNTMLFNGTSNQHINGSASGSTFSKLQVNKASGKLRLMAPIVISQQLILTKGIIGSTATNLITINHGADTTSGGSDSSYVSGALKKFGNQAFSFPMGDTLLSVGGYHPLHISAPTNTTDAFTVLYLASGQTSGSTIQADSIDALSNCEMWWLIRSAGTSVVVPSLGWNSNSCNVTNVPLIVAGWNGTQWMGLGRTRYEINGSQGTVFGRTGISALFLPLVIATKGGPLDLAGKVTDAHCTGNPLGKIDIKPFGGTPPYTYLWSNGSTSQNLTSIDQGVHYLTIKDNASGQFSKQFRVYKCSEWVDITAVTVSGESLTKTAVNGYGNAGAKSKNLLYETSEGSIKYVVEDLAKTFIVGLSIETKSDLLFANTKFAIGLATTNFSTYVNGVLANTYPIQIGDVLEMVRTPSAVQFMRNGIVLSTSVTANTNALKVDFLPSTQSSTVSKIRTTFAKPQFFLNNKLLRDDVDQTQGTAVQVLLNTVVVKNDTVGTVDSLALPIAFSGTASYEGIYTKTGLALTKVNAITTAYGAITSVSIHNGTSYVTMDSSLYEVRNKRELVLIPINSSASQLNTLSVYLNLEGGLVLSPNSDGIYDVLTLSGASKVNVFLLNIYNLDGDLVYTTTSKTFSWNGQDPLLNLIKGTYNYTMTLDGNVLTGSFLIDF